MSSDHHIVTITQGIGEKRTLRGKRIRKSTLEAPLKLEALSADQIAMVQTWVKELSPRRKWNTILKSAGFTGSIMARELLDYLLQRGWIEIEEARSNRGWETRWITFRCYESFREQVGLPNRDKVRKQAAELSEDFPADFATLVMQLESFPPAVRLKRHELLVGLQSWQSEKRYGTRRDFSLFARGKTKNITSAEWAWLSNALELELFGITSHTPLLRMKLPAQLRTPHGEINLMALPGQIGVTEEQILQVEQVFGDVASWKIVENLTSFERCVRESQTDEAVIWVPGHAPSWWTTCVKHLIKLKAAPALISCDPDPAGLLIASNAGDIWLEAGLVWSPWRMDEIVRFTDDKKKLLLAPLTVADQVILDNFICDPTRNKELVSLAEWMRSEGLKGEQEAYL